MNDAFDQLPVEFRERLGRIIPATQWEGVVASFSRSALPSFRVNLLTTQSEPTVRTLLQDGIHCTPVSWCPEAFQTTLAHRSQLTHHRLAEQGAVYLHNLSSIFATLVLDVEPGQTVLDLAAAPGGKTLHIAAQMQGQGNLSAVEPVRNRFFKLKQNLKRAGANDVKCYLMDGRQVAGKTGPRFDRVLLDAPCSSEARFKTDQPASYAHWSLRKIAECKRKQKGLIKSAFQALKPGGQLVYSTCSFAPEENEAIVAGLVKKFGDQCELLPIELPFDNWQPGLTQWDGTAYPASLKDCRRILPNESHNGLFLARVYKQTKPGSVEMAP